MPDLINTANVPLAPSAKTSQTILPDWYTNYAMQVLSNQQASSANPYTTYGAPRVADLTADQQAGMEATRGAADAYMPALNQAQQRVGQAAGVSPLAVASPYLERSGALAPEMVGQYMDPYQDAVVDRIGALGTRNLTERLLPAIGDQFVGAGGYGGSRQAESIGRAVRDTQESISAEQNKALSAGYQGALGAAQTDLSRLGALAGTAGSLGTAEVDAGVKTGGALAALGQQAQSLGLTGAGALQGVGALQQTQDQKNLDVAHEDFLRQQGYDQQQIDAMTKTLQGIAPAVPKSVLEQGYGPVSQGTQSPGTAQTIANLVGSWLLGGGGG